MKDELVDRLVGEFVELVDEWAEFRRAADQVVTALWASPPGRFVEWLAAALARRLGA